MTIERSSTGEKTLRGCIGGAFRGCILRNPLSYNVTL